MHASLHRLTQTCIDRPRSGTYMYRRGLRTHCQAFLHTSEWVGQFDCRLASCNN